MKMMLIKKFISKTNTYENEFSVTAIPSRREGKCVDLMCHFKDDDDEDRQIWTLDETEARALLIELKDCLK